MFDDLVDDIVQRDLPFYDILGVIVNLRYLYAIEHHCIHLHNNDIIDNLDTGMTWDESPQGDTYWRNIYYAPKLTGHAILFARRNAVSKFFLQNNMVISENSILEKIVRIV